MKSAATTGCGEVKKLKLKGEDDGTDGTRVGPASGVDNLALVRAKFYRFWTTSHGDN
jgi:hypothetical protein